MITKEDSATFESGQVHAVYSTFALARDAEWACRLFVLEMKEADEEGIGTFISVQHSSPAMIGETIVFETVLEEVKRNEVICSYEAKVGKRLIATGKQGQKVLKKEKLKEVFEKAQNG